MNKLAFLWLMIGIGVGAIMFQENIVDAVQYDYAYPDRAEIQEMIYAVPPTAAWSIITLNDTVNTEGEEVEAIQYNRKLHIITDGSILIERGIGGSPP